MIKDTVMIKIMVNEIVSKISIPSIVNRNGIEQYVKLELSYHEQELFNLSANTLKKFIKAIDFVNT